MTGTIKRLNSATATGAIKAADGLVFGFRLSAVLAYDIPGLAVGQAVNFELENDRHPRAVNINVEHALRSSPDRERRAELTRLRYLGFQQTGEIRSYRFERFVPGEARATYIVNSDMGLFTRHHVRLQEGPGLCLHLLAEREDLVGGTAETPAQYSLTDREMLAHLATLPLPPVKGRTKQNPPAAGVAPTRHAPQRTVDNL